MFNFVFDGLNENKPQIPNNITYKQKLKILTKNEKLAHSYRKYTNPQKTITHF
jgi:hypothetical protein